MSDGTCCLKVLHLVGLWSQVLCGHLHTWICSLLAHFVHFHLFGWWTLGSQEILLVHRIQVGVLVLKLLHYVYLSLFCFWSNLKEWVQWRSRSIVNEWCYAKCVFLPRVSRFPIYKQNKDIIYFTFRISIQICHNFIHHFH